MEEEGRDSRGAVPVRCEVEVEKGVVLGEEVRDEGLAGFAGAAGDEDSHVESRVLRAGAGNRIWRKGGGVFISPDGDKWIRIDDVGKRQLCSTGRLVGR